MVKSREQLTLEGINRMDRTAFVASLGGIFEHSPWVAERAYVSLPFRSVTHLHSVMLEVAIRSEREQVAALLRAHPDLATRLQVSPLSAAEQEGAGLNRLTPEEFETLSDLNREYTDKFWFPFIMAVRGKSKEEIIGAIKERVNRPAQEEWDQALTEIGQITFFRLKDLIAE